MSLTDFIQEFQADVNQRVIDGANFHELAFAEIVMQHMANEGMTDEPVPCDYRNSNGRGSVRICGYALSDHFERLDMFVSLYGGVDSEQSIATAELKTSANECVRFLRHCASGKLSKDLDPSHEARPLADLILEKYNNIEQIRIYVVTDYVAKTKQFKPMELKGRTVMLEVMDVERLYRHTSGGRPRDELVINFKEECGSPLPCVFIPGDDDGYDFALTAFPGNALRGLYERHGQRLLEANVRSFLSARSKVNSGIQNTLKTCPENFMAYNNGIVVVVDELGLERAADGTPSIAWLKGMQIVNGGQTTASLYFAKKKKPELQLDQVRIPAKIIVIKVDDPVQEEALISDVSRYANMQNAVKQSDLSANKPFHVELERFSLQIFCPDGQGRWYYERAAGSYNTMLAREGVTPAKLRDLRKSIPTSRKITKTDFSKYLMAWNCRPEVVSLGAQKCFAQFMGLLDSEQESYKFELSNESYKKSISKAILFKTTEKVVKPLYKSFKANVTSYTVAVLSQTIGSSLDLGKIWLAQSLSEELQDQIRIWSKEVNEQLHATSDGRMVSEWAKKSECAQELLQHKYSTPLSNIPEMKGR